jgi:hypothetical protein
MLPSSKGHSFTFMLSQFTSMQFWLPGAFAPFIWTIVKWLEIGVPGQYSDKQTAGKQVYADGPAYDRTPWPTIQ